MITKFPDIFSFVSNLDVENFDWIKNRIIKIIWKYFIHKKLTC